MVVGITHEALTRCQCDDNDLLVHKRERAGCRWFRGAGVRDGRVDCRACGFAVVELLPFDIRLNMKSVSGAHARGPW